MKNFLHPKTTSLELNLSFIGGGDNYYQLTSVSFSICNLRHASLFRSYSGNLSAMFLDFRSTKLLRLFSGNLPAMFNNAVLFVSIDFVAVFGSQLLPSSLRMIVMLIFCRPFFPISSKSQTCP